MCPLLHHLEGRPDSSLTQRLHQSGNLLGIFHGITTNPTLLERAGHDCSIESVRSLATKALSMVGCDEFMCQAWDAEDMYTIGMNILEIYRERVVIKVSATFEGTKAASKLVDAGVRVCLTACYSSFTKSSLLLGREQHMWVSKVRSVGSRVHCHCEFSFQCKLEKILN